MKTWQWASIMWILCMLGYYVQDKVDIEPLIAAFFFAIVSAIAFASEEIGSKK